MKDSLMGIEIEKVLENWEVSIVHFLPKIVEAVIVLVLFIFLARIAKRISRRAFKVHLNISHIIASTVYCFFLFSGVYLALELLGLDKVFSHLLAGAGIVGIIAGFAFKDVASNIFAGLLLKTHSPYKEGDWVEIDDKYGIVTQVSLITTTIRTIPGQDVFIPNQIIYSGTFTNYSTLKKRRIILKTGVSFGDDLEFVQATALDEIKKIETLLPDEKVDLYFTNIGNSTLDFVLRFWIKFETNDDFYEAMNEAIMRIKKRFDKEGICLAYPVTTLDFGVKGGVNIFDKEIKINKN